MKRRLPDFDTRNGLLGSPRSIEPLLLIDPETLCDAVYVVEVRAHLNGVGDCPVGPTRGAQCGDVRGRTLRWPQSQLLGVLQQCDRRGIQPRSTPVGGEPIRLLLVDLRPEVV